MPGAEILGALRALDALLTGDVVESGTEEWDVARRAWNLSVDQRPVAVVFPESADDMARSSVRRRRTASGSRSTAAATTPARSGGTTTRCS